MGKAGLKTLQERYSKQIWMDAIRQVFEDPKVLGNAP